MQDRPASAFVQDCMTPLEPIYRNPKTHTEAETHEEPHEEHPNAKTPAQQQQQQQSTHSKQGPSTKSSIRVYQSTGV